MSNPLVSINLVVLNGERYIRHFLEAVLVQTYPHENIEFNILDNGSTDDTKQIIKEWASFDKSFDRELRTERLRIPKFSFIESKENLGMWPGQEKLLKYSGGKYVLSASVDVMIDPNFIEQAVKVCEADPDISAVQAKVYQYQHDELSNGIYKNSEIIDTCGFAMTRGRKVINIGHGKPDGPEFSQQKTIFGVEGAIPFFRRTALEDCRVRDWIWDPDYFWYGDDLDLAWRMTLFGHKQIFSPNVIAWHDRSTTKGNVDTGLIKDYINRRKLRQRIPIFKRRLDWSNTRFTVIKNDYFYNLLKDLPAIAIREVGVQGYAVLFEQGVLLEWGRFLRFLPKMIAHRQIIMKRACIKTDDIKKLMYNL